MLDHDEQLSEERAEPVLIQELQATYRMKPEEKQVLVRVRERLAMSSHPFSAQEFAQTIQPGATGGKQGATFSHRPPFSPHKQRWGQRINLLVAVIVVTVLVGTFVVALSMIRQGGLQTSVVGSGNIATFTPAPRIEQTEGAHRAPTNTMPWGIAIDGTHGVVWVAEPGCYIDPRCPQVRQGTIGKYSLADNTALMDYQEPAGFSSPMFLAVDKGGNVWFTEPNSNAIGELNPHSNAWRQWKLPAGSSPYDLVFDNNDNLWFTLYGSNAIGFLNTHTQQLDINLTPTPDSHPYGIVKDAKGTIWFTENGLNVGKVASFTPSSTGKVVITEYSVSSAGLSQGVRPHLLTVDKAGHVWYSSGFSGAIGKFDPATGNSRNFLVANCREVSCTHISGIAADQHDRIWFTDSLGGKVGYLDAQTGQYSTKVIGNGNAHPNDGLVIDSYGTVWFAPTNDFSLTMWTGGKVPTK
jgi:streptogramin lyase